MKNILVVTGFTLLSLLTGPAHSSEPAYCNKKVFLTKKIKYTDSNLARLEVFQLGRVKLAGLGVGESEAKNVVKMAEKLGLVPETDKYCSWYLNEGNEEAEKLFHHIYLNNPRDLTKEKAVSEYSKKLASSFADTPVNFMYCMEKFGYMALGCNGQKHRGPTVFGMILAYSGCSPQKAADIVNTVWGLNGVPEENRLAIIQAAHSLGQNDPVDATKMRTLFEQE